jgi:hypothetical protein
MTILLKHEASASLRFTSSESFQKGNENFLKKHSPIYAFVAVYDLIHDRLSIEASFSLDCTCEHGPSFEET